MRYLSLLLISFLFLACSSANKSWAIDLAEVQKKLEAGELEGEVHGAAQEQGLYVFTYRNQANFFDFMHFSLVPGSPDVMQILKNLKRHDRVRVKGEIDEPTRPQPHIRATQIEIVSVWEQKLGNYQYQAQIPSDIAGKTSFIGKVHATSITGGVLVVEYKDAVLPVQVKSGQSHLIKSLRRGDKVRVYFSIASYPHKPVHIQLSDSVENPIDILDNVQSLHAKPITIKGPLVMFPKSPQVNFDVFAIQADLGDSVVREYTVVNFEDAELFKQIREMLAKKWQGVEETPVNGRNKLVQKHLVVTASGTGNFVDANQANPQVLVSDLKKITVEYVK